MSSRLDRPATTPRSREAALPASPVRSRAGTTAPQARTALRVSRWRRHSTVHNCTSLLVSIALSILGGNGEGGARGTSGGARGRDFPPTRSHKAPRPLPGRGGADRGAGPRLPRPPKNTASELIFKLGLTGRCWVGGQLELLGGRQHELSETDWDCGGSQSKSGPTFIPDFRDGLERPETIRNQPEQRPRGNIYIPLL